MRIGVPKERKPYEYRVALTPEAVEECRAAGHDVWVEKGAGEGSDIRDQEFQAAGARIVADRRKLFQETHLIVKVKELQREEVALLLPKAVVWGYFHFAANPWLLTVLQKKRTTVLAYETLREKNGGHPLLTPMSEVAGKMAVQEGAKYLERAMGGRGILLGGAAGVAPARVVVIGAGVVGENAARTAAGLGAQVTLMDIRMERLRELQKNLPPNVKTIAAGRSTIREEALGADLLIGAVYVEGAPAPKVVPEEVVRSMKRGSVIVDVAIDQGGCVETSRPTTHGNPVFKRHGVVHYCVTNIPGAVGRTSTYALSNAVWPYLLEFCRLGLSKARRHPVLGTALNLDRGRIVHPALRERFGEKKR